MNLNFIELLTILLITYYNPKQLRWKQHQTTSNKEADPLGPKRL